MKKSSLFIFLLAAFGQTLLAQKIEMEKRIPEQEFPPAAIDWLNDKFSDRKCNRFFLESDGDTTNFEAKFKWQKSCYSVEFLNDGSLKDIEKQVKFKEIPAAVQTSINKQFQEDFKKFKLKKVQEQTLPGRLEKRYEVEIKGKNDEGTAFFEYLFESDGRLVMRQKIILPTNNITLY